MCFVYLYILVSNTGDIKSPLQGGGWFCRGLLVKPVCNSENVYFGVVGINVISYICISVYQYGRHKVAPTEEAAPTIALSIEKNPRHLKKFVRFC